MVETADNILKLILAREENDGNVAKLRIPFQDLCHLISVRLRHHHIQKDQVWRFGPRLMERLGSGGSGNDLIPPQEKQLLKGEQSLRIVIHRENSYRSGL